MIRNPEESRRCRGTFRLLCLRIQACRNQECVDDSPVGDDIIVVVNNLRLTPVSTSGCQKIKTDGSPEKQLIGPVSPT
jgi:hypothetical protein